MSVIAPPVVLSIVPPLIVNAPVPIAVALLIFKVPADKLVVPLYVLFPLNVSEPTSAFVNPPPPPLLITDEIVKSGSAAPLGTVRVRIAVPRATGALMVAVVALATVVILPPLRVIVLAPAIDVPVILIVPLMPSPTPRVVVPLIIVRLLNVVKTEDGSELVAFNTTVPAPGVQLLVIPVVFTVNDPIVIVPPAVMSILLGVPGVAPAFPNVKEFAIMLEPAPNVNVPARTVFPKPPTVTAPVTVIEKAPEKSTIPKLLSTPFAVPPICKMLQAELASTETVKPPLTMTSSLESGTPSTSLPETIAHVPLADQFPVACDLKVA